MRAREFIFEKIQGFSPRKSSTMSTTFAFPTMPSNNPYLAYRFGMAVANHQQVDAIGPIDEFAMVVAYTPEEEVAISAAAKQLGHKKVLAADRGSKEPDSTNKVSIVAKPKKNKYGI